MTTFLMALGLVMVIEGLAFALAPSRIEDALHWLSKMSTDQRRAIGLAFVAAGVAVVAAVRTLAG